MDTTNDCLTQPEILTERCWSVDGGYRWVVMAPSAALTPLSMNTNTLVKARHQPSTPWHILSENRLLCIGPRRTEMRISCASPPVALFKSARHSPPISISHKPVVGLLHCLPPSTHSLPGFPSCPSFCFNGRELQQWLFFVISLFISILWKGRLKKKSPG